MTKQTTRQMTLGNPAGKIILFTIPLLIGNLFQQFHSIADTFIIGRILGVHALAAVGSTGSVFFLVFGFVIGVSSGASMITAQRFGAQDEMGVRRSVVASVWICLAFSVLLSIIAIPFSRTALELMRTPADIIDDAHSFLVVVCIGMVVFTTFFFLANVLRALGDSKTPLIFLIIASILNIAINCLLILGFRMGVHAAAWGTVLAQSLSSLLYLLYIKRKVPILHMRREDWQINKEDIVIHLRVALPIGIQMSVITIGAVMIQFALNGLGSLAVAAFTTATRVEQMMMMPLHSFGAAIGTYAAQNYGARKIGRISKGVFQCGLIMVSIAAVGSIVSIFFGYQLATIFIGRDATEVLLMAQYYLRINGMFFVVVGFLFLFRSVIQGLGKGVAALSSGLMELFMRLFAAFVLVRMLAFTGIVWAGPIAWVGAAIPIIVVYVITMRKMTRE